MIRTTLIICYVVVVGCSVPDPDAPPPKCDAACLEAEQAEAERRAECDLIETAPVITARLFDRWMRLACDELPEPDAEVSP